MTVWKLRSPKKKNCIKYLCFGLILGCMFFLRPVQADVIQLVPFISAQKPEEPEGLYAMSAVLMDGDSGRILFEKDGYEFRPNASTTKVMTCILALENAKGDEIVKVSQNAAAQPDVQLNMREGDSFYLEDLLYSLMLKSHNDTAVAIAEHIGGTVEKFAAMMNQKAREIGCKNTHFVTPNGLDSEDAQGRHGTTARDLALIMRYAVQNETFLKIMQTRSYSFTDVEGKRQYTVTNTNAFLDMMDGIIAGKTGFTGDAGYCYVCACRQDGRTFLVALLGCGWPNNKTYKWADTKKLLEYGLENYHYRTVWEDPDLPWLEVEEGIPESGNLKDKADTRLVCLCTGEEKQKKVLLRKDETIQIKTNIPDKLEAPVKAGEKVGEIQYFLNGSNICTYDVTCQDKVERLDYIWCVNKVFHDFFH